MVCRSSLPLMMYVIKKYGFKLTRNMMICPFHEDKSSMSLRVYEGEKGFFCFGCNRGGSAIDFIMAMHQIDFKAAIEIIKNDFGKIEDLNYARLKVEKLKKEEEKKIQLAQYKLDDDFRAAWKKHRELRKYPPTEEFWENLLELIDTEDFNTP